MKVIYGIECDIKDKSSPRVQERHIIIDGTMYFHEIGCDCNIHDCNYHLIVNLLVNMLSNLSNINALRFDAPE